jgi:hypothetical protein
MKKIIVLLVVSICFSNLSFSQNQYAERIKSDCKNMVDAMKSKNYNLILDYTYPKIIKLGGGREKIFSLIKSSFEKMESEGFIVENQIIEEPQKIFKAGDEFHCIIPKTTIMKTPKGKVQATYYLLGISNNEGKNWFFIETHMLNAENIKLIFLKFNYDLVIPKNTNPTLID